MLIKKELATIDVLNMPEIKAAKNRVYRYSCAAEVFELPRSGKVLVVDVFELRTNKLAMRFFTDAKTFVTCNEWPALGWGNRNPAKLDWYSYFYSDPSDDELVISILGQPRGWHETVSSVVNDWVSDLNWEKRSKREIAQKSLRERLFELYPELPEDLGDYCDSHVFHGSYIFFSKKDKHGRREARCGVCGHTFVPEWDVKPNKEGRCPKCERWSKYKADWSRSDLTDKSVICVAQRNGEHLLLRWVSVRRSFNGPVHKKKYNFYDCAYNLHIRDGKKTTLYSYHLGAYDWYRNNNGTVYENESFVYANNLETVFGDSFHGVNMRQVMDAYGNCIKFGRLLQNIEKYPQTEYLLKYGLTKLADRVSELVSAECTEKASFQSVLGVGKQIMSVYRSMNVSLEEHRLIKAYGKWVSEENVEALRRLNLKPGDMNAAACVLQQMGFEKFLNYFRKQCRLNTGNTAGHWITQYRDYIEMSEVLGVDLSRKSVRYPKDLKEAHDRLMMLFESVGNEEVDAAFARASDPVAEDLGMYSYESKLFCIVVPQSRSDLIREGQSLNHCVGRFPKYWENHVAGTEMIFFIRRTDNRDRPYFTMELDMKTYNILQLYGYGDCKAKRHVEQFAKGFANALKASRKKVRKTA